MKRYSTEEIEPFILVVGVMIFAAVWLPLIERLTKPLESWLRFSLAVVPILLLMGALMHFWRNRS